MGEVTEEIPLGHRLLFDAKFCKPDDPWYRKIQWLNTGLCLGIILAGMFVMAFYPVLGELPVEDYVWEIYMWIESLEPGDEVWFMWSYSQAMRSDAAGQYTSMILQIWDRSSQFKAQGLESIHLIELPYRAALEAEMIFWHKRIDPFKPANIIYGEDYVQYDYATVGPSTEPNIDRQGKDVHASLPADRFGTPTSEIACMDTLRTNADVDMVIGFHGIDQLLHVWWFLDPFPCKRTTVEYKGLTVRGPPEVGHPAAHPVHLWDSGAQPVGMPWYTSGQYGGFTFGVRHCAQYEALMNKYYGYPLNTGLATMEIAMLNFPYGFSLIMWVVGNLGFFMERRARGDITGPGLGIGVSKGK
jgi:hypothetical protein